MWLFTTAGTYSIVQDRADHGRLLVRCRARKELRALLRGAGLLRRYGRLVRHTPDGDYAFRASLPRAVVTDLLACAAEGVDYDNFKDAVKDGERKGRLLRVWGIMGGDRMLDRWRGERSRVTYGPASTKPPITVEELQRRVLDAAE